MLDSKGFKNGSLTQFILLPWKHSCIKCLKNMPFCRITRLFLEYRPELGTCSFQRGTWTAADQAANDLNSCKNVRENDSPAPDGPDPGLYSPLYPIEENQDFAKIFTIILEGVISISFQQQSAEWVGCRLRQLDEKWAS
ncbi:hypothetical protein MUK42_33837 [Musa troglodytarum]|uniref:Uncharacterized protein n=1 Tax=Musa troglodytarum TaxID=320322 RepID=A0A9E7GPC4_9LILI|nr:hypothetical protein MUK42_33837 [Musa troglodytarum]